MRRIKLTQGKYAIVDDEDFERINQFKWHLSCNNDGYCYAVRNIRKSNGKRTLQCMHRVILHCPKEMDIDHRSHDGIDNRKCNLRICTRSENQHNQQIKQQRKTSSRFKGVSWHKSLKKWRAYIKLNGKRIHIGFFINEIAAAHAYDKKAKELFGEFAYLNFKEVFDG